MSTSLSTNEKSIGMELKKTIRQLNESRETAVRNMAETISLAADAGDLILSAKAEGLDADGIIEVAGITGEVARRLERVAKARPSLTNPEPTQLKQLALWSGILPDPIQNATPTRKETHWLSYIFKAQQWLSRKNPTNWSQLQKQDYLREVKPLVEVWVEVGGQLG